MPIDVSRIRAELGWQPTRTLDEGLKSTVDWYLANRDWWQPLLDRHEVSKRLGTKHENSRYRKNGQLAIELQRYLEVTAYGRNELDLTDSAACIEFVRQLEADAIINAAAYTAVDKAEDDPSAFDVNGMRQLHWR